MDIVRAIVRGERDPKKLLAHIRKGVRTPHEELLKALQGTWQPQYLFELGQLLQVYDLSTQQMKGCDAEIELLLEHWCGENGFTPPDPKERPTASERKATSGKNIPPLRVTKMLRIATGTNALAVGEINGGCFLDIVAETGTDLHQFPSANSHELKPFFHAIQKRKG